MTLKPDNESQATTNTSANLRGSIWHRWEPHIHMPGTMLEDGFTEADALQSYIDKVNGSKPAIRAIGITDYYVLDSYEKLKKIHDSGELPKVDFIFPNIELRYAVNASKGTPVNMHLLVSPDDNDHIAKTNRFLNSLKFGYKGENYGCTKDELIRLGKAYKPEVSNDHDALKAGVQQFKVAPDNLKKAFDDHQWAKDNILVAIASGEGDGTAQLQESGLKALREELQRMSQVIFSGRPGDREYWCGKGADSVESLKSKYGNLKPCIHGSDAHGLQKVGNPTHDRFCWIKGDLNFETLRQICFEPETRVHIGKEQPQGGLPSYTISEIEVSEANWLKTPQIPINSGMVAIIGARGSGKTALVEMIAAGAKSIDDSHSKKSFLSRASQHLTNTKSSLRWDSGDQTTASVNVNDFEKQNEDPRVRYLSQQFVDQLCSSDGLADELVEAIEHVIFEAHLPELRLGSRSFQEFRSLKTESVQRRKAKHYETLSEIGEELTLQDDLQRSIEELKRKEVVEKASLDRMKEDRKKLTPSDNEELLDRLDKVRNAAESKSRIIASLEKKEIKLQSLKEEAIEFRETDAPLRLGHLKTEYQEADLTDDQWKNFSLTYEGDVDNLLVEKITEVEKDLKIQKGPTIDEAIENPEPSKATPYIKDSDDLASLTLSLLMKEQRRLETLIGVDKKRRNRYTELSNKISRAESGLVQRTKEIKEAEVAPKKIESLLEVRKKTYTNLIKEIEKEEELLKALYKPLQEKLESQEGTLNKLTFSVNRHVDILSWAEVGERLIDRSRIGIFKGIGTLTQVITNELEQVWRTGSANEISEAMSNFRAKYGKEFWNHAFEDVRKNRESKKHWFNKVSEWLYSLDHVSITYGLEYEKLEIQQLSPGTRGIVLLLLYLSIDTDDQRPLIIDQPEENLDPNSIFHELVGRFKEAKTRRQIIIVTHNANLVVNTDADQVIIASRGEHKSKALPDIKYLSGSLENPKIRTAVCDILEGGKDAFRERAKRLRIRL